MNKKYFFLLTLLFAFLGGVKSEAQITATSQLTNAKAYTIKSAGRGYLFYNPSASETVLYSTSNGTTLTNDTPDGSQVNNQFAFLRGLDTTSGQYYLYSVGAQKFVNISSAVSVEGDNVRGMIFSDTPTADSKITLTSGTTRGGTSGYIIKYANASGWQVNVTNWRHYSSSGIKIYTNADVDEGSVMVIKEAATSFDGLAAAMKKIYDFEGKTASVETIKTDCASKVGYPKTSSSAYQNLVRAYESGTLETSHLSALYSETDVNMPEDGKAYRVYAKYLNGKKQPLYWNGSAIRAKNLENITNADDAVWVFHKIPETDNKYLLVNHNGKYLIFFESESSAKGQNTYGYTDDYTATNNNFTISRATITKPNGGDIPATLTNADLYGCFELNAMGKSNKSYYLIPRYLGDNTDASFHAGNANDKYYMSNGNTYVFEIEEVEYYNKLVFRSPATPDGKYYASIYLPYAATVPTGATAYLGTLNGSKITLTDIASTVIPKNTAVVMVAESDLATQYIAPATVNGSKPDGVTNTLKGTLTTTPRADALLADTYVLNGSFGNIGFYKYTAPNLPKGRAYFEVRSSGVQGFLFDFGEEEGETTGINAAALSNGNVAKTYYDLSGRRIANPKNGLYICNGKKVYIK